MLEQIGRVRLARKRCLVSSVPGSELVDGRAAVQIAAKQRGSAGSICANISFEMSRRLQIGRIVFKLFQNVSQHTDVDRKRCNYPSGATCFSAKSRIFSLEFSESAVVGDPTLIGTRQICWTVGWLDNEGTTQFSWRNGA